MQVPGARGRGELKVEYWGPWGGILPENWPCGSRVATKCPQPHSMCFLSQESVWVMYRLEAEPGCSRLQAVLLRGTFLPFQMSERERPSEPYGAHRETEAKTKWVEWMSWRGLIRYSIRMQTFLQRVRARGKGKMVTGVLGTGGNVDSGGSCGTHMNKRLYGRLDKENFDLRQGVQKGCYHTEVPSFNLL